MTNRARGSHSDRTWRKPDLRHGYTTSACAAACAAAGLQALLSGEKVRQVTIDLPGEKEVTFELVRCEMVEVGVLCGTIKDAGDDPDVTHGAEVQTFVSWGETPGIVICGGEGVGRVTKPGLPVAIGEAAINPGAQRLIERVVLAEGGEVLKRRGLQIEVRVPNGAALAQETLNPRLGIVGGISILGGTGILKPFSNAAYRASIHTAMKVARENGIERVVISSGKRSEQYAMQHYPDLPELAFIQVGDHFDYALRQCGRLGLKSVVVCGMVGKVSKLAQGRMQTHVSQGLVDFNFLGSLSEKLGAGPLLVQKIEKANTAHHVQTMLDKAGIAGFEQMLAQLAARECFCYGRTLDSLEVLLFDIKGTLLVHTTIRRVT